MQEKDMFSYWLTVDGTPEDKRAVYKELYDRQVIGSHLMRDQEAPLNSRYHVPEEWGTIDEWNEEEIDNLFHDIALKVPGVTLHLEGINETNKLSGFRKRFYGDLFQETRTVTTMPPLRADGDIPFAKRHAPEARTPNPQVFLLCQDLEIDGIRNFSILSCSTDRDALCQLLQAKAQKDEHGFLGTYGIEENNSDTVSSVYDDNGRVEYYIITADVLNREQAKALLQTADYADSFAYPDNLRDVLIHQILIFAGEENYGEVNCEVVADNIMRDESFRAMVKQAWWLDKSLSEIKQDRAGADCRSFLIDTVWSEPDYFARIGAIPPFNPPENLKDILIDSIYDVCKANHLPVEKPQKTAAQIMRHSEFREFFRQLFPSSAPIEVGSYTYLKASTYCTHFAKAYLGPERAKPSLASQIFSAESRKTSPESDGPAPQKHQR